jgi:hypothetical protein
MILGILVKRELRNGELVKHEPICKAVQAGDAECTTGDPRVRVRVSVLSLACLLVASRCRPVVTKFNRG